MQTIRELIGWLQQQENLDQPVFSAIWLREDITISDGEQEYEPTEKQFRLLSESGAVDYAVEELGSAIFSFLDGIVLKELEGQE